MNVYELCKGLQTIIDDAMIDPLCEVYIKSGSIYFYKDGIEIGYFDVERNAFFTNFELETTSTDVDISLGRYIDNIRRK